MKIIFFGTPAFAAEILDFLVEKGMDICAVVTRTDKPKGRSKSPVPPQVKTTALKHHLKVFQPPKASDHDFVEILETFNADLFIVVAYGEIMSQKVLDIPRLGCINVHTSLLPKYRGAAPVQRAIIEGETETGVTVMHMVRKMDAGPIIKQQKTFISPNTTFEGLEKNLLELSKPLLLDVIEEFNNEIVESIEQDETKVTFAPKVELEDCKIDWRKDANDIHNLIRGVNPYPGAFCTLTLRGIKKRLKLFESKIVDRSGNPGEIIEFGKKGFIVACGKKALEIIKVQLEGKPVMLAQDFSRGYNIQDLNFQLE